MCVRIELFIALTVAFTGSIEIVQAEPASRQGLEGRPDGAAVARIGSEVITAEEVLERLNELNETEHYKHPKARLEFVQNMVKFKILAREAFTRGLDKRPEARQQFERMLVQLLIKDFFDQKIEVSDQELKRFYEVHIVDYVKPAKVRVQHLLLDAPEGTGPEARAARKERRLEAERWLAQVRTEAAALRGAEDPSSPTAPSTVLSRLAKERSSDAATAELGGDTKYRSSAELSQTYSPEFAKAVFALTEARPLSGVIETPHGFHIAHLLGRQAEKNQPFEDADFKQELKERMLTETRAARFEEYYQRLRAEAGATVDEKAVEAIEVPSAPSTRAAGARP